MSHTYKTISSSALSRKAKARGYNDLVDICRHDTHYKHYLAQKKWRCTCEWCQNNRLYRFRHNMPNLNEF